LDIFNVVAIWFPTTKESDGQGIGDESTLAQDTQGYDNLGGNNMNNRSPPTFWRGVSLSPYTSKSTPIKKPAKQLARLQTTQCYDPDCPLCHPKSNE
jgi:hypothetical protein